MGWDPEKVIWYQEQEYIRTNKTHSTSYIVEFALCTDLWSDVRRLVTSLLPIVSSLWHELWPLRAILHPIAHLLLNWKWFAIRNWWHFYAPLLSQTGSSALENIRKPTLGRNLQLPGKSWSAQIQQCRTKWQFRSICPRLFDWNAPFSSGDYIRNTIYYFNRTSKLATFSFWKHLAWSPSYTCHLQLFKNSTDTLRLSGFFRKLISLAQYF